MGAQVTSPQRLLVNQLVAWLGSEVAGADAWTFHPVSQPDYLGGRHCAVYWLADEPSPQNSTTGWIGLSEAYAIRYWEAASDGARLAPDEVAEGLLEEALRGVRRSVVGHRQLPAGQLADASQMDYLGSRKLGEEDGASGVRGFEVLVQVVRGESY